MIRKARLKDVKEIQQLIKRYSTRGEMLPRSLSELYDHLRDFFIVLMALALVGYMLARHAARRRFEREFAEQRITPAELKEMMDRGDPVIILDLRHPLDFLPYPQVIPGALRFAPEDLEKRYQEIPRDREIILYCT